jgi:IS30 family transposase
MIAFGQGVAQGRPASCEIVKSLTWDRGKEMVEYKRFMLAMDVAVYFCVPQCPWQRGSNENTNGLLWAGLPQGHQP